MDISAAAGETAGFLRKHPYMSLAAVCLMAGVLFRPGTPKLLSGGGAMFLSAVLLVMGCLLWPRLRYYFQKHPVLTGMCALAAALALVVFFVGQHPAVYIFIFCLFLIWLAAQYLLEKNALQTWHIAFFLAAGSFALHLAFILYAPYYSFQHDLGEAGSMQGHLGFIEHFIANQFRIPDFDLRQRYGFQNPPLHHFIAAVWLKIATMLSKDYNACLESLQLLTLFYSGWTTLAGYKVLKELDLEGTALLMPFAIICAHPSLVLFSGLLNNDVLCLALTMQAVVFALRWYKQPTMKSIVCLALCIGLSMMTKSSGAMVAPAVAFLFLVRLLQGKPVSRKRLFAQFLAFGLICIPLGLWWNLYYFFRYQTPLFYVPFQGYQSNQYIGFYPAYQRLFDLSLFQFQNIFHNWGDPYFEYSIPVAVLKTSVFGEFDYNYNPYIWLPARLLFFSNVWLIIMAFAGTVYTLFVRQGGEQRIKQVFLLLFYLAVTGSYIKFCFDFPHSCTMNFRYIVPSFMVGCCFIGMALQALQKSTSTGAKIIRWTAYITIGFFCCASCLFFMTVGIAM